jgi:uroporphyrinogen decarboxylase
MLGIDNFITTLSVAELEGDEDTIARILDMMEILYESHYRYVEACVMAGADIIQCADSLASLDMISPALYVKYAFPYEKRFFDRIARLKDRYEFLTLLHICGNNTPILQKLADTGCDILEVDYKVDLRLCKKEIGNRVCLMGNVNPAGAIFSGTPDEVAAEAEAAMDAAGAGGRFFLGSGCEVAVKAPTENVRKLVEVGHRRGPWPL